MKPVHRAARPVIIAEQFSVRYPEVVRKHPSASASGSHRPLAPGACTALQPLNLTVQPGERLLVLGPSGSGKSTLVSCLVGLVPHSTYAEIEGDLSIDGRSLWDHQPAVLSRSVGVVFQDPDSQLTMLTVEEEIAFGLENLGVDPAAMDGMIDAALTAVGLDGLRTERVDRLSGGMKQRLVIAAILALRPDILVLDEPTSTLDPVGVRGVVELLVQACRERPTMSLVLVEHRIDAVLPLVDRVVVLDGSGAVILDAPPEEAFGTHAALLARSNIWLPTRSAARLASASGRQAEWSAPRASSRPRLRGAVGNDRDAGCGTAPSIPEGQSRRPETLLRCDAGCGTAPVLAFEKVGFAYRPERQVLAGISFTIHPGEVCAVVGENGSGKSTLASLAVGLCSPDQGRVLFDGQPIEKLPVKELARRVGFVFQNPEHQFVTDRVFDEVRFGVLDITEETVMQTLTALRLESFADRNPFTLSHGQKRRLSAATMLVAPKELLVLDEPTFGQDPSALEELLQMLDRLAEAGTAVIMITHDMELVWRRADRMLVLHEGQILADGEPPSLFADEPLLKRAGIEAPAVASYWQPGGETYADPLNREVTV